MSANESAADPGPGRDGEPAPDPGPGRDSEPAPDSAPAPDREPLTPRGPRRGLLTALTLVLLALVVAAVVLTMLDRRADDRERRAAGAITAAETAALAVLDYRPETVAEDLSAAEPLLTQPFLDRFRQQSREVTVPRSIEGQVASSARSAGAAIASVDAEAALVVVYLDRHTVGRDAIPHVLQTVVEVGLVRDGERWLVSTFTPR